MGETYVNHTGQVDTSFSFHSSHNHEHLNSDTLGPVMGGQSLTEFV